MEVPSNNPSFSFPIPLPALQKHLIRGHLGAYNSKLKHFQQGKKTGVFYLLIGLVGVGGLGGGGV